MESINQDGIQAITLAMQVTQKNQSEAGARGNLEEAHRLAEKMHRLGRSKVILFLDDKRHEFLSGKANSETGEKTYTNGL